MRHRLFWCLPSVNNTPSLRDGKKRKDGISCCASVLTTSPFLSSCHLACCFRSGQGTSEDSSGRQVENTTACTTTMIKNLEPCRCPQNVKEILPLTPCEASTMGLIKEVRTWLNTGGDVNATTIMEEKGIPAGLTLLATACDRGQSEVVQHLVTLPSIHLNTRHNLDCGRGCTPLWVAAHLGHEDCVKALLSVKTKCHIDHAAVAVTKEGERMTPVMTAARNHHWTIVGALLKIQNTLSPGAAAFIMQEAAEDNQWDIVQKMLETKIMLPEHKYPLLLNKAYDQNEWDVVCSILEQKFRNRQDSICEILSKVIQINDWNKISYISSLLDENLKVDEAMVKAALTEDYKKVDEFYGRLDKPTQDGIRLVVAVGGTSEEVAYLLYQSYYSSKKVVWESCIYLASMNNRLEVLTHLMQSHRKALTYSALSRARGRAARENLEDAERLLRAALEAIAKNISP